MSDRAARGSLTGRWAPRADGRPNLTGAITLERDMKTGERLWLVGYTRTVAGCEAYVSLVATTAHGGPRKRARRRAGDEGTGQPGAAC